jgi:hypothetical protein
VFGLAEHFLRFFVRQQMLHDNWDTLRHFYSREKAVLITAKPVELWALNSRVLQRLLEAPEEGVASDEVLDYRRPVSPKLPPFLQEPIDIPCLIHVVLELMNYSSVLFTFFHGPDSDFCCRFIFLLKASWMMPHPIAKRFGVH